MTYQARLETTIGAVEVGIGAGRSPGFVGAIAAVAVVVVDLLEGDGGAAVQALEVARRVVEGSQVRPDPPGPHSLSRQTLPRDDYEQSDDPDQAKRTLGHF